MSVLNELGMTVDDLREAVQAGALTLRRQPAEPVSEAEQHAWHMVDTVQSVLAEAREAGEPWVDTHGPALVAMAERRLEQVLAARDRCAAGRRRRRHSTSELRQALGLDGATS